MKFESQTRTWLFALALAAGASVLGSAARAGDASPLNETGIGQESVPRQQEIENNPDLYLQLIVSLQEKNLYFASLAHLDAFDQRWPGNARASLLRGDALRETGYFDKATALYRTLLSGPQAAGAYHGLGIVAGRKGDTHAALAALERASRLEPTNARILNDLGYIQLIGGQLDDARFNLHKATELDAKNVRAGANLALLYLIENKPERAAGIMQWYRLPETHRKDIYSQAERLSAASKAAPGAAQPRDDEKRESAPTTPRNWEAGTK